MARIRSEDRTKSTAVALIARDIDFRHFWRQLTAEGCKSKRPTTKQNDWRYVSPDGSNILVGEEAMVQYALESGLFVDRDSDVELEEEAVAEAGVEAEAAAEVGVEAEAVAEVGVEAVAVAEVGVEAVAVAEASIAMDVDVRASQIDTSTHLSQNTLIELFSEYASDEEPPQPTSFVQLLTEDPSAGLQLLCDASGGESEAPPPELAPVTRRQQKQFKKDINFIPEDENLSEYESFSSGESEEDVDAENEDAEHENSNISDGDDDTLSESDAVDMDEAFVQSILMGTSSGDGPLDGRAAKEREEALRNMQWTTPSSDFEIDVPVYPGLNMEEAKPVSELRDLCDSPLLTLFILCLNPYGLR